MQNYNYIFIYDKSYEIFLNKSNIKHLLVDLFTYTLPFHSSSSSSLSTSSNNISYFIITILRIIIIYNEQNLFKCEYTVKQI